MLCQALCHAQPKLIVNWMAKGDQVQTGGWNWYLWVAVGLELLNQRGTGQSPYIKVNVAINRARTTSGKADTHHPELNVFRDNDEVPRNTQQCKTYAYMFKFTFMYPHPIFW